MPNTILRLREGHIDAQVRLKLERLLATRVN